MKKICNLKIHEIKQVRPTDSHKLAYPGQARKLVSVLVQELSVDGGGLKLTAEQKKKGGTLTAHLQHSEKDTPIHPVGKIEIEKVHSG